MKRALAILGAPPAFSDALHVGRPNIGNKADLMLRLDKMLDRRWLTNAGPLVMEFEARVAGIVGVKHCIAMCNATIALEIAIRAANMDGEVIIPSFTFVATAHALQWQGIVPVFCDIDPATHNIDPQHVERLITPKTTGIMGVHLWGRPCRVEELQEIADRRGLTLLFDAAHAFGSRYRGQMIGIFGRAEVFSFHATKFINCGEGGAVVTNDDALAARIRLMKNFGFAGYDNAIVIGTNGKMNEFSAAMGLTNLDSMDQFVATNRLNYETYQRCLTGIPGISLIAYDKTQTPSYQYVVIDIDALITGITRDQLIAVLQAENVLARRYFYPGAHRMEPYRSYSANARLLLPHTESVAERVLVLPTGTAVGVAEIETVCAIIRSVINDGCELAERLTNL